jgi:fucose 4-O-acetylase-like acetyltransferase
MRYFFRHESVSKPATNTRVGWVDAARGFGICLVVFGHVLRGLNGAGISTGAWVQYTDNWLYSFHMPLFVFLSGLFAPRLLKLGALDFIRDRAATIVYPYVLWSALLVMTQRAFSDAVNAPTSLTSLARIAWEPISLFWFLYALLIHSSAYWLAIKARIPLWALFIFASVMAMLSDKITGWKILDTSLNLFIFFVSGAAAGQFILARPHSSALKAWVALVLGFAIVSLGCTLAIEPIEALVAFAGIAASLGLAHLISAGPWSGSALLLTFLGKRTLQIYLSHVFFTAGIRILLRRLGIEHVAMHLVIGTVAGLALSVLLNELARTARVRFLFTWPTSAKAPTVAT